MAMCFSSERGTWLDIGIPKLQYFLRVAWHVLDSGHARLKIEQIILQPLCGDPVRVYNDVIMSSDICTHIYTLNMTTLLRHYLG